MVIKGWVLQSSIADTVLYSTNKTGLMEMGLGIKERPSKDS